jgi:hypothetical protein
MHPHADTARELALGGDPAAARVLWRRLLAAAASPDPALVLLGAELCWVFGRSGQALAQLEALPTAEELPLELHDLFPFGPALAARHGGDAWLQQLHAQLRRHQQIRAAEQLRQCLGRPWPPSAPPVLRTVHHLACTGGTLISRCLAALPDVVLLSELNPTNRHGPAFNPSHPLAVYARLGEPLPQAVVRAEFLAQLEQVLGLCTARQTDLVLRDHSHSDFCLGPAVAPFQPLRAWLEPHPLLSVVTLRHPLDSWLGLVAAGWHTQLEPPSLRAYCSRYQAFLDAYHDLPWIHYEAFCRQPEPVFRQLCDALCLPCDPTALERFAAIDLSGNSGRSSARIEPRPRRPIPPEVQPELDDPATARELRRLGRRMGYA